MLIPNFLQPEGTRALRISKAGIKSRPSLIWRFGMKFQPCPCHRVPFSRFFQVKFPGLAQFFWWIFHEFSQKSGNGESQERAGIPAETPGFQQCLGWNKALLPCWKVSRILEKGEGKGIWNSLREENRTPRTSRAFWESHPSWIWKEP